MSPEGYSFMAGLLEHIQGNDSGDESAGEFLQAAGAGV